MRNPAIICIFIVPLLINDKNSLIITRKIIFREKSGQIIHITAEKIKTARQPGSIKALLLLAENNGIITEAGFF